MSYLVRMLLVTSVAHFSCFVQLLKNLSSKRKSYGFLFEDKLKPQWFMISFLHGDKLKRQWFMISFLEASDKTVVILVSRVWFPAGILTRQQLSWLVECSCTRQLERKLT